MNALAGNTLAVDIGGTKFAVALFEGDKMIRRESRPTDREGARDWMLQQVVGIALLEGRCHAGGVAVGGGSDEELEEGFQVPGVIRDV